MLTGVPIGRRAELIEWFRAQGFRRCRLEASMKPDGAMAVVVVGLNRDHETEEASFSVGPEDLVAEAADRRRALEALG